VNEHLSPAVETEHSKPAGPLVERLDPAIGELSSVMGAMMTELLRRTLRGSVRQIDDELQGHVAEKVDATISHRLPEIEHSAAQAAEKAAREAATEVAVEEVHAMEQRTKEVHRELASQIEQTARTVDSKTAETARELNGKIDLVERKTDLTITSKAHELTTRIDETAKQVTAKTEETAQGLVRQITEAERRANEAAQAEVARQVEDLLQRSRKTTAEMKDRLHVLETTAGNLGKQLIDEASDRKAEQMTFRADVEGRVKAVLHQLEQQEHARRGAEEQARRELQRWLQEGQARLQAELAKARHELTEALAEARQQNAGLEARIVELEKPRGLRALWAWLFGGRKKAEPAAEEPEPAAEEVESGREA
jgi:hypothetical protein